MSDPPAYAYPLALALISLFTIALERLTPLRDQQQLRPGLPSDLVHLVFNGHFLGVLLFGLAALYLLPAFDQLIARAGLTELVYRNAARAWPLWLQAGVALLVVDFLQWAIHVLLHRVPWLWEVHKCHHSVVDGEMDWIVAFRFQWLEVVVYQGLLYVPLAYFGFAPAAALFHAVFGTLIGHLNHANLGWDYGPLRYLLNNPRMHLWHHDYEADGASTVNFGIIFSCWDYLFGTARVPDHPPARLGFPGVEDFPRDFLSHCAWPLPRLLPASARRPLGMACGVSLLLLAGAALRWPPQAAPEVAASQPTAGRGDFAYSQSPAQAAAAQAGFGGEARARGSAHPEDTLSVDELARALGSPRLVLLDVRPAARFAGGHLPGARSVQRSDFSQAQPVRGLTRAAAELEALLRRLGVRRGDELVLYGDGGPEPYRLWWSLRWVARFPARVLDGGLETWKAAGHPLETGPGPRLEPGDVAVQAPEPPPLRWSELSPRLPSDVIWVDARSPEEFSGREQHRHAARPGRLPGARNLPWDSLLRGEEDRRLLPPPELRERLSPLAQGGGVAIYCQTGTRSSLVYFALRQAGIQPERVWNYDGSWAEYSQLALPAETCE